MNGDDFLIVKHNELDKTILNEIIKLKSQHWNYSYESQLKWIENNIEHEDLHILLIKEGNYLAYLSIQNINIKIDDLKLVCKGIGNVCVNNNYQNLGYGKKIIEKANNIICSNNDIGFLLCHPNLVKFYNKCGWTEVNYNYCDINKKEYTKNVMVYNYNNKNISVLSIDRNF